MSATLSSPRTINALSARYDKNPNISMKVILHADDFGYDDDTSRATIELLNRGILTSATIMVNSPAANTAIAYAKGHPDKSFGVHLTYVDGLKPISSPKDIPSLVDETGVFLPSDKIRKKAMLFSLRTAEIERETAAQLQALTSSGVAVSHVDSHGHIHKFPQMLYALGRMKQIPTRLRRVQNIFLSRPKMGANRILNLMFAQYIQRSFRTTDYFYMPANHFDIHWGEQLLQQMDKLPINATLEIGVHPGYQESWRQHEFSDVCHFAELLHHSPQHQLITWQKIE
jgi:predicted glycoside hydrolase/deacetylase ChbG (UPF0249 family)